MHPRAVKLIEELADDLDRRAIELLREASLVPISNDVEERSRLLRRIQRMNSLLSRNTDKRVVSAIEETLTEAKGALSRLKEEDLIGS